MLQPGNPAPGNESYIAASYVKFIESGGARAVPILYDAPRSEVERIFNAVNGVLIPGGGQNLSPHHPFFDTSTLLLNLTLAANDAGDFFPVRRSLSLHNALACCLHEGGRPAVVVTLSLFVQQLSLQQQVVGPVVLAQGSRHASLVT